MFVIGIGDSKKWQGVAVKTQPHLSPQEKFLWRLNYNDAKKLIKFENLYLNDALNHNNDVSIITGVFHGGKKIYDQDTEAGWWRAYIYDKKGNINFFGARKLDWLKNNCKRYGYIFLDKYKLDEAEPNWDKVYKLQEAVRFLSEKSRRKKA